MTDRTYVSLVILMCGLSAGQLFAQAAAESVLTHGLSSTAGSSVGKTLGNAIGNAAGQLGGRLGQQASAVPRVKVLPAARAKTASVPAGTTTAETASSSGSLIASIQGGATSSPAANCAVAPKPPQADTSKSKAPAAGAPGAAPVATCQAQDADSHPAVVNLPAAN